MQNIDRYAYASRLKNINPIEKLVFALLTLCVCLWADWTVVSFTVLLIMSFMVVKKGGTPFSFFAGLMAVPIAFLGISIITIAFGISGSPQQFDWSLQISGIFLGTTWKSTAYAVEIFLKALGAVSCLYFLSLTTPLLQILSALRKFKCPEFLIEIMSLIYRFIFIFLETADNMYTAQNSRLGYSGIASGFRSLGSLASTLFIRAYKRSNDLYTALEARGYEGELKVLEEKYEKNIKAYVLIIGTNLVLIIFTLLFKHKIGGLL